MSLFGQFTGPMSNFDRGNLHDPVYSSTTNNNPNYGGGGMRAASDLGDDDDDGTFAQALMMAREFSSLKQEHQSMKDAISILQNDRDKLRVAVRKLKVENNRFKAKLKRVAGAVASKRRNSNQDGEAAMDAEDDNKDADESLNDDFDFDNIGEFLLIGGPNDPLAVQYRSPFRDANGNEHKSVERYLWYKMAETFDDKEAMNKILKADKPMEAEEVMQKIKNFDEKTWDAVKLRHWEDGHRAKFDQYRSLKCLLIKTGKTYLAIAGQDKLFGTGWRKQRDEAARPHMWDGENRGGKFLMKLRDEYSTNHTWTTADEEKEAQNSFYDNRRNVWRKTKREGGDFPISGRGRGGGGRGGNNNTMARNFANMRTQQPIAPSTSYYLGTNGAGTGHGYNAAFGQNFPMKSRSGGGGVGRQTFNKRGRF